MRVAVFLLIISILLTGAVPDKSPASPLQQLAEIAQDNDFPIEGWEVTMRETLQTSNYKDIVNNLLNSHLVAGNKDENRLKYDIVGKEATEYLTIEQQMIVSKGDPQQVELVAVLSGTDWNAEIKQEYEHAVRMLEANYFHETVTTYTCINLLENATIEDRVVINTFLKSLDLLHMEEQIDSVENSTLENLIYGYTHLWNEKFVVKGIPYNFQMAVLQNEAGESAYTIGTPILMNEY